MVVENQNKINEDLPYDITEIMKILIILEEESRIKIYRD